MRQPLGLLLGWLGTTALAVVLAVGAVGVVSDSVTENRPRPLSPAAVSAALAREVTPAPATPAPSVPVTGAPAAVPPSSATTARTTPTTAPNPGTQGTTDSTSVTGPASTTTPTTGQGRPGTFPPPEERTYDLVGGSVRVRFADGKAERLGATPNNGFRVISGDDESGDNRGGDGEVRVRFRSDGHESRLRAYWENGPQAEIEENRR